LATLDFLEFTRCRVAAKRENQNRAAHAVERHHNRPTGEHRKLICAFGGRVARVR
jgi:hypothetical protein